MPTLIQTISILISVSIHSFFLLCFFVIAHDLFELNPYLSLISAVAFEFLFVQGCAAYREDKLQAIKQENEQQ